MNICLLNDSFPPVIDGVANAVINYATIIERDYGHAIVSTPAYPGVEDNYPFEDCDICGSQIFKKRIKVNK